MPAPYSEDLAEKMIIKHFWFEQSVQEIAWHLLVDPRTVKDRISRWEADEPLKLQGRTGVLNSNRLNSTAALNTLLSVLERNDTLFLEELAERMQEETGVEYSLSTLCRGLKELGWTRKKVKELSFSVCRFSRLHLLTLRVHS